MMAAKSFPVGCMSPLTHASSNQELEKSHLTSRRGMSGNSAFDQEKFAIVTSFTKSTETNCPAKTIRKEANDLRSHRIEAPSNLTVIGQ